MLPPEPPPPFLPAPGEVGQVPPGPGHAVPRQAVPGQPGPGYGAPYGHQPYGQQGSAAPRQGAGPGYPAFPGPHSGYQQPGYQQAGYGQPLPAYPNRVQPRDPALAEWWRRLLARIIDGIVVAVVLGLALAPLWVPPWTTFLHQMQVILNQYQGATSSTGLSSALGNAEAHFVGRVFYLLILAYLGVFAYDWAQHALWGQTIGKRALGTQVVTADGHGKITPGAAGGRAAVYALAPAVPLVGGLFSLLNELWLTWDPRRQCLHDKAAHTVVIKKNYRSSNPQAGGW
jgi:uncharacterized RDD family membrane protein YckC